MNASPLPALPETHLSDLAHLEEPSLRIRTDEDVVSWKSTTGYKNYMLFLRRLTESVVGYELPASGQDQGNLCVVWVIVPVTALRSINILLHFFPRSSGGHINARPFG